MIKKLLSIQTKSISTASIILAGFYLISAIMGFLRERLLAGKFGAGNELDVYYAAFTIPDFVALLLVFGAISAAIIPIFNSYLVKSKDEAWRYISALFNVFLAILIVVCIVFIIFAPLLVSWIAPGFSPEKQQMTALLMRIMFLSPIILGISNIMSGLLQVFHRFLVTALAPIMYNAGIIIGILFFVPRLGLPGLAWGVVLGGALHLSIQLPAFFYSGFSPRAIFKSFHHMAANFKHPGVLKTLKLMVPRSLGLGAGQFNTIVITSIASTLAVGSVAVFNLANTLSSILINAIAVSLSTAIFPAMSLAYSRDNKKDFEKKFSGAFRQILFLTIPVSILIFILRAQIVRVILGTGKFSWIDTRLTAACLGIFSLGLAAQGLIFIFSKTFYAAHNTKIPAIVSVLTVVFNIMMSFWLVNMLSVSGAFFDFIQYWLRLQGINNISVIGLSMAFAITAILEALVLLFFIYVKLKAFRMRQVLASFLKIALSGIFMALAILATKYLVIEYGITNLQSFLGVFLQLVSAAAAGIVAYILSAYLLKSPELETIKTSFFKLKRG